MKYIPHKVIRSLQLSSMSKSNIFFFDATRVYPDKLNFALENTTIYLNKKSKEKLKDYVNDPKDLIEGYGFLREDGLEIQIIEGKQDGEYLIIADPSDESNIPLIRQDFVDWLGSL